MLLSAEREQKMSSCFFLPMLRMYIFILAPSWERSNTSQERSQSSPTCCVTAPLIAPLSHLQGLNRGPGVRELGSDQWGTPPPPPSPPPHLFPPLIIPSVCPACWCVEHMVSLHTPPPVPCHLSGLRVLHVSS